MVDRGGPSQREIILEEQKQRLQELIVAVQQIRQDTYIMPQSRELSFALHHLNQVDYFLREINLGRDYE